MFAGEAPLGGVIGGLLFSVVGGCLLLRPRWSLRAYQRAARWSHENVGSIDLYWGDEGYEPSRTLTWVCALTGAGFLALGAWLFLAGLRI